jgi:hypothetical protein
MSLGAKHVINTPMYLSLVTPRARSGSWPCQNGQHGNADRQQLWLLASCPTNNSGSSLCVYPLLPRLLQWYALVISFAMSVHDLPCRRQSLCGDEPRIYPVAVDILKTKRRNRKFYVSKWLNPSHRILPHHFIIPNCRVSILCLPGHQHPGSPISHKALPIMDAITGGSSTVEKVKHIL